MKKSFKIIILFIIILLLLALIFGITDYNRLKNGKRPIFIYRSVNISENSNHVSTAYYGFGYKLVDCKYCTKKIIVLPFYLGTYAWFIGSDYITNIEIVNSKNCNNKSEIYYEEENRNIYVYCLDKINVIKNNEKIELKKYLETNKETIDFILNNFTKESYSSYDDGGSKLYTGEEFNLLKCHTIDNNNDIYIGNKNMGYFKSFCKGENQKENNL